MNFDTFIGPNGKLCVRPKNNATYNNEFFLKQLEQVAGIKRQMGIAVVNYIGEYIAEAMAEGATVTIDGLGTFAPSLTINKDTARSKLDGNVVELSRITFRPHPDLKKSAARKMTTHRVKLSQRKSLNLPDIDERKDILVNLLKKKPLISSTDYMNATHISRSAAYADLIEFEKGGVVKVYSVGRNKMYALPEE